MSPYAGKPVAKWAAVTRKLVNSHPLKLGELREAALSSWKTLWQTKVGAGRTAVRLSELRVPATIVGYFLEVLLARELERLHPGVWRGTRTGTEKDLVYIPNPQQFSIEIKASGQAGFKLFGNRSYGQKAENDLPAKKEKSGYYLTVNFHGQALTLLRFGWIDADDWSPQRAQTGQMAGLSEGVYAHKLIRIRGDYRQDAPVILLTGVGPKMGNSLEEFGIKTIRDLLARSDQLPPQFAKIKEANDAFLSECYEQS